MDCWGLRIFWLDQGEHLHSDTMVNFEIRRYRKPEWVSLDHCLDNAHRAGLLSCQLFILLPISLDNTIIIVYVFYKSFTLGRCNRETNYC